jgi:hypothetical protein
VIVRLKRSRAKKGVPASLLRVLVMILAAGVSLPLARSLMPTHTTVLGRSALFCQPP